MSNKLVSPPTREALVMVVRNAEEQLAKHRDRNNASRVEYWKAALKRKEAALAAFDNT